MTLPPDDERTILASNQSPPGPPGNSASHTPATTSGSGATPTDPAGDATHNALAVGTRLGEFEITGLLGEGGFGIVYLAYDSSLERHVALKEYMPSSFASRTAMSEVRVKSERHLETFQAGLRSFVHEARMLAQFDHPSLIKVYRFWEANGTAYMIMPYYQGVTLKQALRARTAPVDEAWLKSLLAPLLDTLTLIHDQQCFHRDIAPDNIMMIDESQPVLLDFGAARRAISGMDQAFTVILKQGYAPIEQYAETPGMTQGAWTDLFALASVVHFAIDGKPPPPAVGRVMADPYVPLAQRYAGRYSAPFLDAIDKALSVRPEERPQSAAAMRTLLGLDRAGATIMMAPATASRQSAPPRVEPAPAPPVSKSGGKGAIIGAGIAAALLVAAGIGYALTAKEPTASVAATSPVQPAVAVAPVAPVVTPVLATALPPKAVTFDPLAALNSLVAGASAERSVKISAGSSRVRINRDRISFNVTASHAGYIYVHMLGTAPDNLFMMFPNTIDSNNRIKAGETLTLPRKGWLLQAAGPAGQDHIVVMVSDAPRDFTAANGVMKDPFLEFTSARVSSALQAYTGATPLLAGAPDCAATPACPALYGASMLAIEEYVR